MAGKAKMGRILVGTCGWTDSTLLASGWYPPQARTAEARLGHYASTFPLVEVDSTYYALPSARNSRLWVERTPEGFVVDVKAFRLFTHHPTPLSSLPRDLQKDLSRKEGGGNLYLRDVLEEMVEELLRRFQEALLLLDSAGKLGAVLFQFPPWFHSSSQGRDYVQEMKERMGQFPMAVEFRATSWLNEMNLDPTVRFLEENRLPFVAVDEPQGFLSSLSAIPLVTADLALVRFHGRNRENWEKKGITATERFRYLYTEDEFREWMPRLREMTSRSRELHVLFNNCYGDYAVRNRRQVQMLLD